MERSALTMARAAVAVLGGGLTGLSASWHLAKAGVAHRAFEKESVAGGHAVTVVDGSLAI